MFAHGFTCSKDTKAAAYIARALAEAGFGVLRFDFTGLGSSGGDFGSTHFSSNVDDLVAASDCCAPRTGRQRCWWVIRWAARPSSRARTGSPMPVPS